MLKSCMSKNHLRKNKVQSRLIVKIMWRNKNNLMYHLKDLRKHLKMEESEVVQQVVNLPNLNSANQRKAFRLSLALMTSSLFLGILTNLSKSLSKLRKPNFSHVLKKKRNCLKQKTKF